MSYPRFTKIIIDYFMSKDQSISRRNNMFWHTTRDDTMFASIRCISRHEVPRPEKAPNQSTSKMKVIPDTNHAGGKNLFKLLTSSHASGSSDGVDTRSKFLPCALATNRLLVQMKEMLDVDDANDDDKQEGEDMYDDDEETDKEEEEYDDEFNIEEDEKMDEEEDDEVTKKWYKDVNINLGNKDADMTDADQGRANQQNVSQQSGFDQEEEDAHNNPSPADNEIASLMNTTFQHATTIFEITSSFTTTIPPPPPFFNHLQQEETPTPTPTTSETTTSLHALLDFASIFKFNERVTNLEKDLLEMKQADQYAQALSSIPAIVDRYIDNKLGEAINKAI
ncbi:hypothetical protein Tco_0653990 [Tanacetum coccineum]|uniref:Uncharacterized protein n=1 Tax=Tanacetum coccineum TaxID=301880 RepID=A0ABQ4X2W4_9ASTR